MCGGRDKPPVRPQQAGKRVRPSHPSVTTAVVDPVSSVTMATSTTPCPNCGNPSSGRFCSECGAAMLGVSCNSCGAPLTPGAHFCHRCGAAAGAAAGAARVVGGPSPGGPAGRRSIVPWIVAGAGALALVILVAAQQGKESSPTGGDLGGGAPLATGAVRGPDISAMSPRERADRLYDRVMRLVEEGKSDSAAFFSTMAVGRTSPSRLSITTSL
jgi:hypothetical protein